MLAHRLTAVICLVLGLAAIILEGAQKISGDKFAYTVTVDGGNTMKFVTEPVIGGDGRTPIEHSNINNPIVPSFYQGKTVSATYKDGERSFTLE